MLIGSTLSFFASPATAAPAKESKGWKVIKNAFPQNKVGYVYGMSCPSTSACFGIGYDPSDSGDGSTETIVSTQDGETSWRVDALGTSLPTLNAISCATPIDCVAVGDAGVVTITTDAGETWTQSVAGSSPLYGISCADQPDCVAVGASSAGGVAAYTTADGGETWTPRTVPSDVADLYGVTCTFPGGCEAVGADSAGNGLILTSSSAGMTWSAQTLPENVPTLLGVSCSLTGNCAAVGDGGGGDILFSGDSGSTWSEAVGPDSGPLTSVSCFQSECLTAGTELSSPPYDGSGAAYTSSDGGAYWFTPIMPSYTPPLTSISCSSESDCVMAGFGSGTTSILSTVDTGSDWVVALLGSGPTGTGGISCLSSSFCAVTTANDMTGQPTVNIYDNKTTSIWDFPSTTYLYGISCATTSFCVAVGQHTINVSPYHDAVIFVTTNSGTTWSQPSLSTSGQGANLITVSCPTSSGCIAAGEAPGSDGSEPLILVTTDEGAAWTPESGPSSLEDVNSVSCVSMQQCVGVGAGESGVGEAITTNNGGGSWTSENIPNMSDPMGVTCRPTMCVAVGGSSSGSTITAETATSSDGGIEWATSPYPAVTTYLRAVSCSTRSDCVAIAESGQDLVISSKSGGDTWKTDSQPLAGGVLDGVSCPSSTFCEAVGDVESFGAKLLRRK
jgi:photosystem II stability/assembly factor-like uncharacterized protein